EPVLALRPGTSRGLLPGLARQRVVVVLGAGLVAVGPHSDGVGAAVEDVVPVGCAVGPPPVASLTAGAGLLRVAAPAGATVATASTTAADTRPLVLVRGLLTQLLGRAAQQLGGGTERTGRLPLPPDEELLGVIATPVVTQQPGAGIASAEDVPEASG